jgi:polyisoprenyl-teichoic acid--peptidoglycan teichoic acid transferase
MREQPPTRRKASSRPHWYNQATQGDTDHTSTSRRGKARERAMRRREQTPGKALPTVNWSWGIIAAAIAGVIGVISLIMLVAASAQPKPTPTVTLAAYTGKTVTPPTPTLNIRAWDGKQRFTVLVLGLDKRPGEIGTGFRTDTMILLSIDPATKTIGMLSIPRDLYVPIPGESDMQKINSAYVLGELRQPGNGPKVVAQTIQYNFGIPVNRYVVVSFDAVIGLVDAVGGIDLNVPQAIDDPEYPDMNFGFDPLYIPTGMVHMDGQLALKYARTRHTGTDYDRANRQQQVIMAIRQKALKGDVLPQLVGQAPALWDKLSKGVITDFTFDQALSLGWYLKDIPVGSIKRATIEDKYIQATQYNGETVLTPNRAKIGELMIQVFGADYSR